MNHTSKHPFHEKHMPGTPVNESIKKEMDDRVKNKQLSCAVAFAIAHDLNVLPKDVGITADLLNYKLIKCQLGLFGYSPNKKKVEILSRVRVDLKEAINASLVDKQLPCKTAWQIAERCHVSKIAVSNACETLGVKIKSCQLGAF
jgi:hypothetical protein